MIPRAQIHHRFGEKCADIEVVRIFLPNRPHGLGIGLIERRAILRWRIGITVTQRFDQIALHRRRVFGILLCELKFLPRYFHRRWRHHRKINVRPACQSDSPMRHRTLRIEPCRFLERPNGCAVVEAVQKRESLIEISLRLRRIRRDLARVGTKPFEKWFLR